MFILFLIALVICIIGLIFTIKIGQNSTEGQYDYKTSAKNMSWLYFIFLPVILILLGILYYFLS